MSSSLAFPRSERDDPRMIRQALLDRLADLPEHLTGEIVGGELHVSPRPAKAHGFASTWLGGELHGPFGRGLGGPGGWVFIDAPELRLGDDIVIPDLAAWQRPRDPRVGDQAYSTLAPDWVCEVISPSTARFDRSRKLPVYAREGVRYTWLLDPIAQTLEVFALESSRWTLLGVHAGDEKVRAAPFEAYELEMAGLWGR